MKRKTIRVHISNSYCFFKGVALNLYYKKERLNDPHIKCKANKKNKTTGHTGPIGYRDGISSAPRPFTVRPLHSL